MSDTGLHICKSGVGLRDREKRILEHQGSRGTGSSDGHCSSHGMEDGLHVRNRPSHQSPVTAINGTEQAPSGPVPLPLAESLPADWTGASSRQPPVSPQNAIRMIQLETVKCVLSQRDNLDLIRERIPLTHYSIN